MGEETMSKEELLANNAYCAVCNASNVETAEWCYSNYLEKINGLSGINAVLSMKYLYACFCCSMEGLDNAETIMNSIKVRDILKTDLLNRGVSEEDLLPESVKQRLEELK